MPKKKPQPKPEPPRFDKLIRSHIHVSTMMVPKALTIMCWHHRRCVSRCVERLLRLTDSQPANSTSTLLVDPMCEALGDTIAALNAEIASVTATYVAMGCPSIDPLICAIIDDYLSALNLELSAAIAEYNSMGC